MSLTLSSQTFFIFSAKIQFVINVSVLYSK